MRPRASSLAGAVLCTVLIGACQSSGGDAAAGGGTGTATAGATAGGTTSGAGSAGAGPSTNGGSGATDRGGTAGEHGGRGGGRSGNGNGNGGSAGPAAGTGGANNGGASNGGANKGGTAGATSGGSGTSGGVAGGAGQAPTDDPCDDPNLVWRTANKTNYTSYPDPGSEECVKYNGCTWAGQFAACDGKKPEDWVASHNIVAAFPDFSDLELHDLCLREGDKTIVVTVLDTCGDSDCDGCCTENRGSADELIDVESYTNDRWGVSDGAIEWADLGMTMGDGCGG